jgi:hypothetical protein
VKVYMSFLVESDVGHDYHIHTGASDPTLNDRCGVIGSHFAPEDGIGPDENGVPYGSKINISYLVSMRFNLRTNFLGNHRAEVGDLSGKHGQVFHNQRSEYTDPQVQLSGPFSILGRSIAVHSMDGSVLDCCTIGVVPLNSNQVLYFLKS